MKQTELQNAKNIFWDYLKSQKLKITKERERILEEVFSTHAHFDAEGILVNFKNKNITISRATIYRTLELLVECELVNKMSFDDNSACYEHIFGHAHHDHLVCQQCGRIIEFCNSELETLQQKICEKYQFIETDHSLKIFGLCKKCQDIR